MPEHASAEWLRMRLRWLAKLRWAAALFLAALALTARFIVGVRLPWPGLLLLALVVAVSNLIFLGALSYTEGRRRSVLTFARLEFFANMQIGLDLAFLTLALHCSGGVENPFVILYVLPPIMASVLLTRRSAYLQATWAALLLMGIAALEAGWPALHHPVGDYLPVDVSRNPLVIAGEVVALAASVYASVYLVGSIVRRLHLREQQLREARDALERSSNELTLTNRDLQALEERKSRFLSLAAHQLRGPLAAAESCIAAACDGYTEDPEKRCELLKRGRNRIQGMLQIVRDLLTLAGAHELAEPSRRTPVALGDVVRRVAEQYAVFAASRHIELTIRTSEQAIVMGEERALADALGNLVSNAIKYTPEGGHVKVFTRVSDGRALCEVVDDGIGIPEEERERLFEDFFRASNARESGQEGTGLGLSIVKEIVEKHGGSVSVESLPNLGACVLVTLPLANQAWPVSRA